MELEHAGRRYPLGGGELVLGSDPQAGIVLAELRPRHAAVRPLGTRMATIRPLEAGAEIQVNGVNLGREPMPLVDGDVVRLGRHELRVRNPAHPSGGPDTPPPGARERLHDTLFGLPREGPTPAATPPAGPALAPPSAGPARPGRTWIVVAAVVSLLAILALLAL